MKDVLTTLKWHLLWITMTIPREKDISLRKVTGTVLTPTATTSTFPGE